ncbi:MAG: calcium-translocating P-type ATPase, PMCA-type [Thermoguttaceae bacterium]
MSLSGLSHDEVVQSRKEFGRNELTPPPREAWWWLLLEKFRDTTIIILIVAATVSLAMTAVERFLLHHADASFIDSIGIFLAIALAVLVAFLSERRSAKAFELLNQIKDDITIKVIRGGKTEEVSIGDVVVNDLVRLSLGDKIPADGVFVETSGLSVDQSLLTGESMPAEKEVDSPGFRGTMVTDGHGILRVTAVGDSTEMGKIASSLGSEATPDTPLQEKLARLAKQLSVIGISAATLIFIVMVLRAVLLATGSEVAGFDLAGEVLLAFLVAVTVVVVAVPEGLPMMVTVSLALNMMKMAREKCLIRKLVASETIGSATVICSDKTGTLTRNEMRIVWACSDLIPNSGDAPPSDALVRGMAINTSAEWQRNEDGKGRGIGNPTESAMLAWLDLHGIAYAPIRETADRTSELAHNSARKLSIVQVKESSGRVCLIKGAPERILDRCTSVLVNGQLLPFDTARRATIDRAMIESQQQALRVIAFAQKESCSHDCNEDCLLCSGLTLVALIGIADPIREAVPAAVAKCHRGGIDVKMITGDALPTARAIATQASILSSPPREDELVLTSEDLARIDDDALPQVALSLRVLARATPMDKLRLVKALHKTGAVVAMTGDGTNDAPALKVADVGISMGITGTEVAKEASDIVLLDDNFTTIVTGVLWGRTLYRNIQRFLQLQLSVNVVALVCAVLGPLVGVPLPFTVVQLLWINIIMDTFAAIALSSEPPRPEFMQQRPVPRHAAIITPQMLITILICSLWQIGCLFAALWCGWFVEHGYQFGLVQDDKTNIEPLTVFFTVFVMFQFWHKFNCRALTVGDSPFTLLYKNRPFIAIVGITTLVQIAMVQTGGVVGQVFRTVPLSLTQWIEITLFTATIIPVGYAARWIAAKLHTN